MRLRPRLVDEVAEVMAIERSPSVAPWVDVWTIESLTAVTTFAFEESPRVHRILLDVLEENRGALSVYQTIGYQREGIAREALVRNGRAKRSLGALIASLRKGGLANNPTLTASTPGVDDSRLG